MTEPYTGPERRKSKHDGGAVVTNDALDDALALHAMQEREAFEAMLTDLIKRAFPDGPENHYKYHDKLIKAAEAQAEFWQVARVEVVKRGIGGLLHVIGVVLLLALIGFSIKTGIPIPFVTTGK